MSRRSKTQYFKTESGAPEPLSVRTNRIVRFEEIDPLGIVWHGRYVSYLEDGRAAFGKKYGLTYLDMYHNGFLAPIVQMHIDYHDTLTFPEEFTIKATLHWTEAVRLNFSYQIKNNEDKVVATAYTVQLFTDLSKKVLLFRPDYVEAFVKRWKENSL